jgi:hypothetical protein
MILNLDHMHFIPPQHNTRSSRWRCYLGRQVSTRVCHIQVPIIVTHNIIHLAWSYASIPPVRFYGVVLNSLRRETIILSIFVRKYTYKPSGSTLAIYSGIFAQSMSCEATETAIVRQRLCNTQQWSECSKRCFL